MEAAEKKRMRDRGGERGQAEERDQSTVMVFCQRLWAKSRGDRDELRVY